MTSLLRTFVGMMVLCIVRSASAQDAPGAACGVVLGWRLPDGLILQSTNADTRTQPELVTQARVNAIVIAAEAFCRASGGRYPRTFAELAFPDEGVAKAMGRCLIEEHVLKDAWERPIFFAAVRGQLVVQSAGPDGRFTTQDDVTMPSAMDPHSQHLDLATECRR